ncbi:unnamed protein product [Adineta ricciae]|uniref:Uncharacterized protein n=1 Tax=Adineta ricciae TaxID=249248 RepID=A0A814HEX6_ADIRI|nr:unnamed protein product [Adineta ricciae]CAF1009913.1 unnamed protein product [Adineta ricciae]
MIRSVIFCFALVILFSVIVHVKPQVCYGMNQYDRCSKNTACGCLPIINTNQTAICGILEVNCSQFIPCKSLTNECDLLGAVCVQHPGCNDLPVCYPLSMGDERSCPITRNWINTGSMKYSRYMHQAIALVDGKVLVMGGIGDKAIAHKTAELYDGSVGIWTATGNMTYARFGHTASALKNGKILVTGGNGNGKYLNTAELYDPSTRTWTTTGNMSCTRFGHRASVLANGKVLVTGGDGRTQYLNTAELYDPSTETWTLTDSMKSARYRHTATVLTNGKVLVTGGYADVYMNTTELYDPTTETWTTVAAMNKAISLHTASLLSNGKVLITGGVTPVADTLKNALLFDPTTESWTSTSNMNHERHTHTASVLPTGEVLVTGGFYTTNTIGYSSTVLNSAELYNPTTETWTSVSNMTTARGMHTAFVLVNRKVLIAGGSNNESINSAEIY